MSIQNPYEEAIQNSDDLILSMDPHYRLLMINNAAELTFSRTLGISPKRGDYLLEMIPEFLAIEWKRRYDIGLKGGTHKEEEYYTDGKIELYFELSIFPIIEDDLITGVCVISRDITSRKLMEIGLRESEERYRQIALEREKLLLSLKEYTYHMSHVVRRPVCNLMALSHAILDQEFQKNDLQKSLEMIVKESEALDEIIREVNESISKTKWDKA